MKLLIATPLYPPETGGPATYARTLEEDLPKRGFTVTVAQFSRVRGLPRVFRHLAYFFFIVRMARDVDIVFALDPVSVGLPALCTARLVRKRFFLKVVGDFAWEQYVQHRGFIDIETFQTKRFGPMTELRRFVQRFVARRAERVVVPSQFLRRIVRAWGVPSDRITVVYNSFESPATVYAKQDARRLLGVSGTVVVSAGRLVPWKGFRELIALMPALRREFPDAVLYVAGDGPLVGPLEAYIEKLGLKNVVQLLDRLDRPELFKYVAAADVFVLNTGYEGFSHQLLETMSLGTPIVTTSVGGNPELIEDGVSGRLVPFGRLEELQKAILELLRHPPAGAKFVAAAQNKAQEFTVERMVEETMRVFARRS